MAIKIGHAASDEERKASGGKAGDQTGKEGSGATGETSKGGSHNVDPNGFVVKTARNTGISFGD